MIHRTFQPSRLAKNRLAYLVAVIVVRLHLFDLPAKPAELPKPKQVERRYFM